MKLSTATSVFVNYPIKAAVDHIIRAGYDGVDLWCGRPHLYRRDHTRAQLTELRLRMAAGGLTPVSVMPAFFRYPYSLSSPNPRIRTDSIRYVEDCITVARQVGARQVLIVPTASLYGQTTEDARDRFRDSVNRLCAVAREYDLTLAIELLYARLSDYMHTSQQALETLHALGQPCLKMVLDTGHLNLSGESIEAALATLGRSVVQVHVNDNDGQQQQNNIPGTGTVDFAGLKAKLDAVGYDGFLTVELGWHYSFDPAPPVKDALRRMRGFLGQT